MCRKWYKSETLGKRFLLYVTNKARRTIEKYGGFDNYLTKMPHHKLCSDFGSELKHLIEAKKKDPSMQIPYIPKTAKVRIPRYKKELRRT